MCDHGTRNRIYRMRALARELNRVICRGADPDGDEVALMSFLPPTTSGNSDSIQHLYPPSVEVWT
jgi:hypothetical protein